MSLRGSEALQRRAYALPEKGWEFPLASLTEQDALALALVRGIVGRPGMPQQTVLLVTLDKLTSSLLPALGELMQEAAQVLQPGQPFRLWDKARLGAKTGAGMLLYSSPTEQGFSARSFGVRGDEPCAVADGRTARGVCPTCVGMPDSLLQRRSTFL